MKNYEQEMILFCEKYGIIEAKLEGNTMTYYETWYEGHGFVKYECKLNLDTMEEERKPLK